MFNKELHCLIIYKYTLILYSFRLNFISKHCSVIPKYICVSAIIMWHYVYMYLARTVCIFRRYGMVLLYIFSKIIQWNKNFFFFYLKWRKCPRNKKTNPLWLEHPLSRENVSTSLYLSHWTTLTHYKIGLNYNNLKV